jgi:hypothetical protein
MYINADFVFSYTDREKAMRPEIFFLLLYFSIWLLVSLSLGDYWVSADPAGPNNYPPAFPYVSIGFIILYFVTIILIRKIMTDD